MIKKPLKISWRSWCLYKLAKRDYSSFELERQIIKRADQSDQNVDASAIVKGLVNEGLVDDKRYLKVQLNQNAVSSSPKGPRELKRKLQQVAGISDSLLEEYLVEDDSAWEELARKSLKKWLLESNIESENDITLPEKTYHKLKQKLYRKGFTSQQIQTCFRNIKYGPNEIKELKEIEIEKAVESLIQKGKGPFAIKQYLHEKRVAAELIEAFLQKHEDEWLNQAKFQRQIKFGSTIPKTYKEQQKQISFLIRKGFSAHHAKLALNTDQ